MVVGGGSAALLAALNQLRPRAEDDHAPTMLNTAGLLGGLGTAAYGLSGGKPEQALHRIGQSIGLGSTTTTPTAGLSSLGKDPRFAKYIGPGGEPNFRELAAAPDTELQSGIKQLSPEQRVKFQSQLAGFKPTFGQRLGAKALGIDVEGQRERFKKLLST